MFSGRALHQENTPIIVACTQPSLQQSSCSTMSSNGPQPSSSPVQSMQNSIVSLDDSFTSHQNSSDINMLLSPQQSSENSSRGNSFFANTGFTQSSTKMCHFDMGLQQPGSPCETSLHLFELKEPLSCPGDFQHLDSCFARDKFVALADAPQHLIRHSSLYYREHLLRSVTSSPIRRRSLRIPRALDGEQLLHLECQLKYLN
jgi:hypothetical protein